MIELLQEGRIEQLMQELEQFPGKFAAPSAAGDLDALRQLMMRVGEVDRELKAIQSSQMATLTGLIVDRPSPERAGEGERIARLLRAFELVAELRRVADDVIGDTNIKNQWTRQGNRIVTILDAVDPQRRQLIPLLKHPLPDVRALAGVYLMEVMPERALPVLRAVYDSHRGLSAGWTAFFVLRMHDVEQAKKEEPPS
jgi:hypothetical protein